MYSDSDTVETVGCPIRKSMDQSLFAAPHGLSQRTTSFIASYRQGIHQMPFCHLIALIINAHPSGTDIDSEVFWLVYINVCFLVRYRTSRYSSAGTITTRQNTRRR